MKKVEHMDRLKPNIINHFSSNTNNNDDFYHIKYQQFDSFERLITNNAPLSHKKQAIKKQNLSFIRLLNVIPNKISIDIFINKKPLISNLSFKNSTHYLSISSGVHHIDIFKSGDLSNPIHSEEISLLDEQNYTIAIGAKVEKISLFSYTDDLSLPLGEAKIRFINLSPSSTNLDFAVKAGEGDVVFSNVPYRNASEYLPISPMTVNLEIRLSGTKLIILPLYQSKFQENIVYDLVSVGSIGGDSKFDVIKLY
ncbi:hypothetical protein CN692_23845 [Bacillus sp. AFS002410]|uniref:DUF4397 domain-containing protein n=1 Tax=Bacillus sp. AFS002410 TaxID=2033481 RepID=UPI000BF0BEB8|nr:DUF4397 domain-containing protein [Bacillus sp. AFS002410]PEJ48491.1 hypothetical protein CN692_23845 [Bacillus sp. AFS002410]